MLLDCLLHFVISQILIHNDFLLAGLAFSDLPVSVNHLTLSVCPCMLCVSVVGSAINVIVLCILLYYSVCSVACR